MSLQRLYKDNGYICTVLNSLQAAVTCSNSGILKTLTKHFRHSWFAKLWNSSAGQPHGLGPKSHLWRAALKETTSTAGLLKLIAAGNQCQQKQLGKEGGKRKVIGSSVGGAGGAISRSETHHGPAGHTPQGGSNPPPGFVSVVDLVVLGAKSSTQGKVSKVWLVPSCGRKLSGTCISKCQFFFFF